jgi:hypothetical protein
MSKSYRRNPGPAHGGAPESGAAQIEVQPSTEPGFGMQSSFGNAFFQGVVHRDSSTASGDDVARAPSAFAEATDGPGGEVPYRAEMEAAFGEDFSGVEAHTGSGAALGELGASAAAAGEAVAFASADPDPGQVAHELTHVVQSRNYGGGGVMALGGLSRPGSAAEREATAVGDAVGRGEAAPAITAAPDGGVQRDTEGAGDQWPEGWDPSTQARALYTAFDGWGTDERQVLDILYTGRRDMTQAIEREYNRRYSPGLEEALHDELSGGDLRRALQLLGHGELTLRDRIREAVDGWGTDEEGIFNALERASAEEIAALAADTELRQLLREDLNDDDWALAEAYLSGRGQLAASLRRSVAGWGTDEDAIWRAIEGASPSEREFVLSQPALLGDLRDDLSDADWMRASRMLRGQLTNADRVEIALEGWGTDELGLKTALAALTAEELGALPADIDARLEGELSGADLAECTEILHQRRLAFDAEYRQAWTEQQSAEMGEDALQDEGRSVLVASEGQDQSAVGRLLTASAGMGTDESSIFQVLSGLTEAEKRFIRERNPSGVMDRLRSELSDSDYARAEAIVGGGAEGTMAALRESVEGWGTDDDLLYQNIDALIRQGHARALLDDAELLASLTADISEGQGEVLRAALRRGELTPMLRLRWATDRAGTDEDLVWRLCEENGEAWRTPDGGVVSEVDAILQSELSTRDYWRALDAIRGEPRTEAERLARSKEMLERERGGVSTGIMDTFSHSGEHADDAWREYQATYNQAIEDGQISEEETGQLREDEAFSERMTAEYREAKAAVAQWATTIAVAVVGIAATILTAGAAGPFVAALAAQLGGTAAIAAEAIVLAAALKVGLNRAIQGEGYDVTSSEALVDAVSASVEVGLTMVGGQLATQALSGLGKTALARSVGPSIQRVFGSAGQRILGAGLEGSIDGTIGGLGEGLVQGLAQDSTWEGDINDVFSNLGNSVGPAMLMSAAGGMIAGSGFQSLGETFGPMVRRRMGGGETPGGHTDGPSTVGDTSDEFTDIAPDRTGTFARSGDDTRPRNITPELDGGSSAGGGSFEHGQKVTYEGESDWEVVVQQDGHVLIARPDARAPSGMHLRSVDPSEVSLASGSMEPSISGPRSGGPEVDPGTLGPNQASDAYNGAPRDRSYVNRSGTQELHVDPDADGQLRDAIDTAVDRISRGDTPDEQLAHLVDHVHNDVTYDQAAQQAMYNDLNSLPVGQARLGEMIQNGAVVCREKAIFTHQLLSEMGIESRVVTGNVQVNGGSYGHAWVVLADGTVVDGTWGKIYPRGDGYPVDRVIKEQVFSSPRSTLDPTEIDQAVARGAQILDDPKQLRALQAQVSDAQPLSPADQLLTNGNTVTLPERRGGLLGLFGMKKKARITRVERDMVFVDIDGKEVMYPRAQILEANGVPARTSNATSGDRASVEDDSHRAYISGEALALSDAPFSDELIAAGAFGPRLNNQALGGEPGDLANLFEVGPLANAPDGSLGRAANDADYLPDRMIDGPEGERLLAEAREILEANGLARAADGAVPDAVAGVPLSGAARDKYQMVLDDTALPDALRQEYLAAVEDAVARAGDGADIRQIMTQVAREERFMAQGPAIHLEDLAGQGGMTRVVPLKRVWEDNLDAAYRARFESLDDWVAQLEADPSLFDPARHLDPSTTIPGKYATAWWAPRASQNGNTMAELMEELALNPTHYQGGMLRVTASPEAAARAGFRKPTALDGMGFDEFVLAPGHAWGITADGSLEAISGRISLSDFTQTEFLPSGG